MLDARGRQGASGMCLSSSDGWCVVAWCVRRGAEARPLKGRERRRRRAFYRRRSARSPPFFPRPPLSSSPPTRPTRRETHAHTYGPPDRPTNPPQIHRTRRRKRQAHSHPPHPPTSLSQPTTRGPPPASAAMVFGPLIGGAFGAAAGIGVRSQPWGSTGIGAPGSASEPGGEGHSSLSPLLPDKRLSLVAFPRGSRAGRRARATLDSTERPLGARAASIRVAGADKNAPAARAGRRRFVGVAVVVADRPACR